MEHVFPACSITRFAGADGAVSVKLCRNGKELRLPPRDEMFCAKRAWDQHAESGYMKEIEDGFQNLANQVTGSLRSIDTQAYSTVTRFFVLWCLRFQAKHNPIHDRILNGIVPEVLTKDQQEILEKNWGGFIRSDQTMPGRRLTGVQTLRDIDRLAAGFQGRPWGIVRAEGGEFILPDTFAGLSVVPLTPMICLVCGHKDSVIPHSGVSDFNRRAVQSAKEYFIARDFTQCPL
jgi:hypothetical protein